MSSPEGECPDPRCKFGLTKRSYFDHEGELDWDIAVCDWPGHGIVLHLRLERIVQRGRWRPKLENEWAEWALLMAASSEHAKVRLSNRGS